MAEPPVGPIGKKQRKRYVGSWRKPVPNRIALPFTADSLKEVLQYGASPETSPYTHQHIAHWCDRFHMATLLDERAEVATDIATKIAADVDAQWELYLLNTYTLEELQILDFSSVPLPVQWFQDWLVKLGQALP